MTTRILISNQLSHTVDSNSTLCGTTFKDPKTGFVMSSSPAPINIILLICVVFEGLLFAIFTMIMFAVQMQAIWNDETSIEQLKKETNKRWSRRQRWRNIRAVFGLKGFSFSWFSPFTRVESIAYVESNYTVWLSKHALVLFCKYNNSKSNSTTQPLLNIKYASRYEFKTQDHRQNIINGDDDPRSYQWNGKKQKIITRESSSFSCT